MLLTGDSSDAEDLLQTTLLRTIRHVDRVADMAAPAAYLRQVMLNEHLSHGRDEAWAWLAGLKPQQRTVLVLAHVLDR